MKIKAALFDLYKQNKVTYFSLVFCWILGFSYFINTLIGNSHAGFPFDMAVASLVCFGGFIWNEKKLADEQPKQNAFEAKE